MISWRRKYFENFFLTNFLGRGWLFSRAVLQAGRDIFEMKTSRAIHPERLTSNHATSSIQLDLPRLWSSKGICYFPDLFSAERHSGMAGWETGRPHRVKMEHNLTGALAEAWEGMGHPMPLWLVRGTQPMHRYPGSTLGLPHGIVTLGSVIQPPHLAYIS